MRFAKFLSLIAVGAAAQAGAADLSDKKIFIDPETGERRAPATDELKQAATQQKPVPPLSVERTADGVRIIRLGPAHRSALRAERAAPGEALHIGHVDTDGAAQ